LAAIGSVYFVFSLHRFRRVIFGDLAKLRMNIASAAARMD
jgi:hypothetical protein